MSAAATAAGTQNHPSPAKRNVTAVAPHAKLEAAIRARVSLRPAEPSRRMRARCIPAATTNIAAMPHHRAGSLTCTVLPDMRRGGRRLPTPSKLEHYRNGNRTLRVLVALLLGGLRASPLDLPDARLQLPAAPVAGLLVALMHSGLFRDAAIHDRLLEALQSDVDTLALLNDDLDQLGVSPRFKADCPHGPLSEYTFLTAEARRAALSSYRCYVAYSRHRHRTSRPALPGAYIET